MSKTRICSFCGHEFSFAKGIMYIKNDGTTLWFCSSKCRKNGIKLKRDPRKLKWTSYYKKEERTKI